MDTKRIQGRFQDLLAERNLTPHGFATEYNLNVSTITGIAGEKQVPSLRLVFAICECLGVGPERLLSDDDFVTLNEQERNFMREYISLDSSGKDKIKGYLDRLQDEKEENEHTN